MIQGKIFVISQSRSSQLTISIGLSLIITHHTFMSIMNGSTSTAGTSTQVVIGSMERAEEYGAKLTELKSNGGNVQGEMVDRVLDKGMLFRPTCQNELMYSDHPSLSTSYYSPSPTPSPSKRLTLLHPALDSIIHPPSLDPYRIGNYNPPSVPRFRFIRPTPPNSLNKYHSIHFARGFVHPNPNTSSSHRQRSGTPSKLQASNDRQSKTLRSMGSGLPTDPRRW